jgi:carbonic anhydrase
MLQETAMSAIATRRLVRTARLLVATASTLSASVCLADEHAHWSYSGPTGPEKWSTLEQDFGSCGLGKTQSPIDIRDAEARKAALPPIDFAYQASPLRVIDNGHTIQVNYAPGSFIAVGGRRYELVQFHFHKPSEEKVNGKNYDMVAHLVHRDSAGKLAVVAVLLAKGTPNPLLDTLWSHIPTQKNEETVVEFAKINVADLLPESHAYYTFTGSLTTPPCTEGVTWLVLQHPTSVSAAQVARFGAVYPMNARPVQPRNGRTIQASR